jgi:anti-sigma regulatory factor (Ser/Thr protein kinase)
VTTESPIVRLDLESRPQTLTIVRGMLGGVAEQLAVDPELLDDLKTAISEACNNVVLHAYGDKPGPMGVRLYVDDGELRVEVEDDGIGVAPDVIDHTEGVGLSVMRALARELTVGPRAEGGTLVEMRFTTERAGRSLLRRPSAASPDNGWQRHGENEVLVSISPVALLTGVLGRLARTLAATAHFSLDRFSDVYLVTDTIAAHAIRAASASRIDVRLSAGDRRLQLDIGRFRPGTSELLRASRVDPAPSPLVLLTDEVSIQPDGDGELLHVVVIDHRR